MTSPIRFSGSYHLPHTMCTWPEEEKLMESTASLGFGILPLNTSGSPQYSSWKLPHSWEKQVHSPPPRAQHLPLCWVWRAPLLSYGFATHFLPKDQETMQRGVLGSKGFFGGGVDIEKKCKGKDTVRRGGPGNERRENWPQ